MQPRICHCSENHGTSTLFGYSACAVSVELVIQCSPLCMLVFPRGLVHGPRFCRCYYHDHFQEQYVLHQYP